ncbi:MAG: PAN domain-containing protein [Pseudomonadota bacterium]
MRPFGKFQSFLLSAAVILGIVLQWTPVPAYAYDRNTDRPGGDYTSSELPSADPRLCAARCEIDNQCAAWSYTAPGVQGPAARCSLKNGIPAAVANNNAASDIRPFEYGTDRPGSDYSNFELQTPNPAMCAARCSNDAQCQAWSYVQPGVQGTLARCWLKNAVPPATAAAFAVSGVRSFEYDTDRPGSDYSNFELTQADPAACAARCAGDAQCQGWTYVMPGVQGPSAHCWLKNAVPPSVAADFAVSGVRAHEPGFDRPGGDYNNFTLDAPDPQLCAARCAGDSQCAAWTYSKPGATVGGLASCSLKNSAPPQTPSVVAVSGLRAGPPQAPPTGLCPTPPNFAGLWNEARDLGTIVLTQTGSRVEGTYTNSGGGTLDGTVTGCVWQGEWINSDKVRRGTFRVVLSQDGKAFNGTWETTGAGGRIDATR